MLTASPLAVVGLVLAWKYRAVSRPFALALLALPVVWIFQYSGGANPQWGGRYVLVTGTLLVITGAIVLSRAVGFGRFVVLGDGSCGHRVRCRLAVAALVRDRRTGCRRSSTVTTRSSFPRSPTCCARAAPSTRPTRGWLTAATPAEIRRAVKVARESGATEFGLLVQEGGSRPRTLEGFTKVGSQTIEFPGLKIYATTYRKAPAT